jgi:hypothetical protein
VHLNLLRKKHRPQRNNHLKVFNMQGIFPFPACLISLFLFLGSVAFAEVGLKIQNCLHIGESAFKRIPEYFTGHEFTGRNIYCRSNPSDRSGYYFVIKVNDSFSIINSSCYWIVDWVPPRDPNPRTQRIPLTEENIQGREVFVGLTGEDWKDPLLKPLAWRISLLSKKGVTLGQRQSFLWSK